MDGGEQHVSVLRTDVFRIESLERLGGLPGLRPFLLGHEPGPQTTEAPEAPRILLEPRGQRPRIRVARQVRSRLLPGRVGCDALGPLPRELREVLIQLN